MLVNMGESLLSRGIFRIPPRSSGERLQSHQKSTEGLEDSPGHVTQETRKFQMY